MDGKLILLQKTTANNTLQVNAAGWTSGVYFVEVVQGDQRKVIKLVKL